MTGPLNGDQPLLRVEDLVKHFPVAGSSFLRRNESQIRAVDGVSFEIAEGETLGLVGESGCGKSTLARLLLRLLKPDSGSVSYRGTDLVPLGTRKLRPVRKEIQMIFQDPYTSLNPRKRIGQIVGEPLRIHDLAEGKDLKRRVQETLERVGLQPEHYSRYPHEFSGGQRQRIGIARALAPEPRLIVADEPVSALDVSIQAQIVNLLSDLQAEFGLTYLFVSHDLGIVRQVSRRIAVMYLGKLVELGPAEEVYRNPIHPYTASLIEAVPVPDPRTAERSEAKPLGGDLPSPADPPSGCRFHPRCPRADGTTCSTEEPALRDFGDGHFAGCHHPLGERTPVAG